MLRYTNATARRVRRQMREGWRMANLESGGERREYVAGLEKGLAVIEAFAARGSVLTLSEAAALTGCSRASARRCLRTLEALGYVQSDGKYFSLAPRVLRLGHAYTRSNPLPRLVQSVIEAASERTGEAMSVTVLDDIDVVVIARALVRRPFAVNNGVGSRLPAFASAAGRVLLAALPEDEAEARLVRMPRPQLTPRTPTEVGDVLAILRRARAHGYAVNDQEVERGVRTLAVPVRNRGGAVIAALSESIGDLKTDMNRLAERRLPDLEAARARLAALL
jgi:IclR family pca regulon transcriptional regulator